MSPLVTLNSNPSNFLVNNALHVLPGSIRGLCPLRIAQRYCRGSPQEVISAKPLVSRKAMRVWDSALRPLAMPKHFWVVLTVVEGRRGQGRLRCLICKDQGCCWTWYNAQDSSVIQPKTSITLRLRSFHFRELSSEDIKWLTQHHPEESERVEATETGDGVKVQSSSLNV